MSTRADFDAEVTRFMAEHPMDPADVLYAGFAIDIEDFLKLHPEYAWMWPTPKDGKLDLISWNVRHPGPVAWGAFHGERQKHRFLAAGFPLLAEVQGLAPWDLDKFFAKPLADAIPSSSPFQSDEVRPATGPTNSDDTTLPDGGGVP